MSTAGRETGAADAATEPGAGGNYLCDRCDREARHVIRQLEPGGGVRYVCWSCLSREEKRHNLREGWRREGRARNG